MRGEHIAIRTCVGCFERFPKGRLVRFVISDKGIGLGNASGRGLYLCRSAACLEKALKRRNLKGLVAMRPCDSAFAALRQVIMETEGGGGGTGERHVSDRVSGGGAIG